MYVRKFKYKTLKKKSKSENFSKKYFQAYNSTHHYIHCNDTPNELQCQYAIDIYYYNTFKRFIASIKTIMI